MEIGAKGRDAFDVDEDPADSPRALDPDRRRGGKRSIGQLDSCPP
jgi:hypothetical protein